VRAANSTAPASGRPAVAFFIIVVFSVSRVPCDRSATHYRIEGGPALDVALDLTGTALL